MRHRLFHSASRLGSSPLGHAGRNTRTYASKADTHPSDSIPIKGALPISTRNLRRLYIYGGSALVLGGYVYLRSRSRRRPAAEAVMETPWTAYTLAAKDRVSPTAAIFTLKSKQLSPESYDAMFENSIWAVDVQQPQLQIVREYTPLPPALDVSGAPVKEGDTAGLHLLIREEYKGEVSGYLHRLPQGADVQVSRPYAQINLDRAEPERMVFVVGGTGITTALQAIHALLETKRNSTTKPSVHILWANRKREECLGGISDTVKPAGGSGLWGMLPSWLGGAGGGASSAAVTQQPEATELGRSPIVDELRRLKDTHKGLIKVDYFVDEEGTFVGAADIGRALSDATVPTGSSSSSGGGGKTYVAISGPDGFMINLAGEGRGQKNRISEPPSTGILGELRDKNWRLMVLG